MQKACKSSIEAKNRDRETLKPKAASRVFLSLRVRVLHEEIELLVKSKLQTSN